jgi:hypothetical protein
MLPKRLTTLACAAVCLTAVGAIPAAHAQYGGTQVITNGPVSSGVGGKANWSPRRNVVESKQYTQLLQTNRGFRNTRKRRECGPITDPQLRESCLESFNTYSPWMGGTTAYGSSGPRHRYPTRAGR